MLMDFINFMFAVLVLPLGMFGIYVGAKLIVGYSKEIKEIDKEKFEEKICLKK
ncbi:hypothetical protein [Bacillus albus]|uniref:hypothetical protein n=1 Tax=Bacillus albus TaxID=2026189 RepID=UPI003015700E